MKEFLCKLFLPHLVIIKQNNIIYEQDKQYLTAQLRIHKLKLKNKILDESNTKYLENLKAKTLKIKELKNEIKELTKQS